MNDSRLALAPHLGFPTPDNPLFRDLLGSIDPVKHIQFAEERGFSGIQDPFSAARSPAEQEMIGAAADAAGLSIGCFVYTTVQRARKSMWGDPRAGDGRERDIEEAMRIGRRLGGRHIAILSGTVPHLSRKVQFAHMAECLGRAADHVAKSGFTLCIEAVSAHRLPDLLLHHVRDAYEVVCRANHPAVRLIFDTAHVQAMDGEVGASLNSVWDKIEIVQLADGPKRSEPGSAGMRLDFILTELSRRQYKGLVELEHGWSAPGPAIQLDYLHALAPWLQNAAEPSMT